MLLLLPQLESQNESKKWKQQPLVAVMMLRILLRLSASTCFCSEGPVRAAERSAFARASFGLVGLFVCL